MKTTPIDQKKAQRRRTARRELKQRGPIKNEKSVAELRERVALLERMIYVRSAP